MRHGPKPRTEGAPQAAVRTASTDSATHRHRDASDCQQTGARGKILRILLLAVGILLPNQGTISVPQARSGLKWNYHVLDLVVTEEIFEEVCKSLHVSEVQHHRAAELHRTYMDAVNALEKKSHEEMRVAGWREIEQLQEKRRQFLQSRRDLLLTAGERERVEREHYQAIETLMLEPMRVVALANRDADKLLDQFLQECAPLLTEQQLSHFDSVLRLIRRLCYFHREDGFAHQDFQRPIDLFDLLRTAAEEADVLVFLSRVADDPWRERDPPDGVPQALVQETRSVLAVYETRFDAFMLERLRRHRRIPNEDTKWTLTDRNADDRREIRKRFRAAAAAFRILNDSVDQVGHLLSEHLGPKASATWRQHFHKQLCPNLMAPRWADDMMDWLEKHDPSDSQLAAGKEIHKAYLDQRAFAIDRAIAAAIRAKERFGLESGDSHLQQIVDERREMVGAVEEAAIRSFCQILNQEQQALLLKDLGREDTTGGPGHHEE